MRRLILFDIDGTLLRTKGAGRNTTRDAMLEVFGTASTIETHHFGGKTDWFTLTELLTPHGFTQELIGERIALFEEAMGRHMARHIVVAPARALPGAMEAVERLRHDDTTMLGIVTGNAPTSARLKLQSAGFDPDWFPVGAFGTESVRREDLPLLALRRAEKISGVTFTAEQCTVIGDTAMDVAAARANDMRVIVVRTGFEDPLTLESSGADHVLDNLTTLFDVL